MLDYPSHSSIEIQVEENHFFMIQRFIQRKKNKNVILNVFFEQKKNVAFFMNLSHKSIVQEVQINDFKILLNDIALCDELFS